jgi:hypothetical protein
MKTGLLSLEAAQNLVSLKPFVAYSNEQSVLTSAKVQGLIPRDLQDELKRTDWGFAMTAPVMALVRDWIIDSFWESRIR